MVNMCRMSLEDLTNSLAESAVKSCKMVSVSVSSTIFMSNVNHRTNEMSRTWCIATKLSSAEVIRPVPLIYTLKKVHSSTLREVLSVLVIWRWWGVTQYIENSHSVLKALSTHTGMSKCFGHAMGYNMGRAKVIQSCTYESC